ncbi:globin domain-containing protein [Kitasatospora sp. NBC_00374]|uniref:globin domain-containing protein n=1 Tax=Kitasatospora sp. NBC_00374 TaxID=2975964 RepID=UPI0030DEE500
MTIDPAVIKSSFALVEPHGAEVAAYFYRNLFEHNPSLRGLFAAHLDEQQERLWAALGALVTHLEDVDTLVGLLQELGRRHAGYGARPEHFPAVGASLIATLAHFAGPAWTAETESSWAAVHEVITSTMGTALAAADPSPTAG